MKWFEAMDSFPPYSNRVAGDEYSWVATSAMFARIFGKAGDAETQATIARSEAAANRLIDEFHNVEDECDAAFALEAAKKIISNHEAIALDCTNQDPRSQKNIGRSVDKGNAERVIQKVAEILLKGNKASTSAKTFPLEDFGQNSRNDAAIAARTIASRLCTPRDMSAPAAKILRGVLMIVAERLESETREKKRTKILNAAKNLFARLKV